MAKSVKKTAKKTTRKNVGTASWRLRGDPHLPPFNTWVIVFWRVCDKSNGGKPKIFWQCDVGARHSLSGGGWRWDFKRDDTADKFEAWAVFPVSSDAFLPPLPPPAPKPSPMTLEELRKTRSRK